MGRGRQSRRPLPRKKLWLRLVVPALLTVGAVLAVLGVRTQASQAHPQDGLLRELGTLIGDNYLFTRPGLSSDGGPSWHASAYGLPALAAATGRPPELAGTAAVAESLKRQIADDPIWARWYTVQVEYAGGTVIPGHWAQGILESYAPVSDPAQRIAMVAAVADVVRAKSLPVPAPTAHSAWTSQARNSRLSTSPKAGPGQAATVSASPHWPQPCAPAQTAAPVCSGSM